MTTFEDTRPAWVRELRKQLKAMQKSGNTEAEIALLKVYQASLDERKAGTRPGPG